ncbi:MAG TPA: NADP-dependent oxidoreductase [Gaiellaceae bacterium]|jgi:NADPH:quinone reductase-like Zn-dependent oxidoreductase|nr:NADP-dependent oxidoreductase [Gaiellaceae bacterium]
MSEMRAIRLHPDGLKVETIAVPEPGPGELLVRVHAAALTRDELDWPTDRLPAIPSYEVSGDVAGLGDGVEGFEEGEEVYALTGFDRDGAAAEYTAVAAGLVARKPRSLSHIETAALPLAGLSAWQALFDHGKLESGERVLIHGASGGVGQFATQLALWRGAHVIGTATGEGVAATRALGADEVVDREAANFEEIDPVDLVFDTVGGDALRRSPTVLRDGGRLVSVAEEPPPDPDRGIVTSYFVVEPNQGQLEELARLADEGALKPAVDSVYPLENGVEAFERLAGPGKRGKVVIAVLDM